MDNNCKDFVPLDRLKIQWRVHHVQQVLFVLVGQQYPVKPRATMGKSSRVHVWKDLRLMLPYVMSVPWDSIARTD